MGHYNAPKVSWKLYPFFQVSHQRYDAHSGLAKRIVPIKQIMLPMRISGTDKVIETTRKLNPIMGKIIKIPKTANMIMNIDANVLI